MKPTNGKKAYHSGGGYSIGVVFNVRVLYCYIVSHAASPHPAAPLLFSNNLGEGTLADQITTVMRVTTRASEGGRALGLGRLLVLRVRKKRAIE